MSPEEHWERFTEFCTYELAAGGPDPHMRYIGYLGDGATWTERVWLAGIYAVGVYNFATAEVIWRHWPWEKAAANPEGLARWISDNWPGLKLRRERRAVRTPGKLGHALLTYLRWMEADLPLTITTLHRDPERAYEEMWAEAMSLYGTGRYAGFKLLETLTRYCELPIAMPDLRPRGGWSPRLTLAALQPEMCRDAEATQDTPAAVARAEQAGEQLRERLSAGLGTEVDRYRFEVFLCDYRQSYDGERQYPGRSVDSEIEYHDGIHEWWEAHGGHETALWEARGALTPEWARAEATDRWWGVRDDLGPFLNRTGQTWSDWLYEYPIKARRENRDPEALRAMARATLDAWPH